MSFFSDWADSAGWTSNAPAGADEEGTQANEPLLKEVALSASETTKQRFREFWVSHGVAFVWLCVYVIVNGVLFIEWALKNNMAIKLGQTPFFRPHCPGQDSFDPPGVSAPPITTQTAQGSTVTIPDPEFGCTNVFVVLAKGFGEVLNLQGAVILFPVCRVMLTWLRATPIHKFVPLDYNIVFHRTVAWIMVSGGSLHGMLHYFNYAMYTPDHYSVAWGTLAGATGHLLSIALILMLSSAVHTIRRKFYNFFFLMHALAIPVFILYFAHGPRFYFWAGPGLIAYIVDRTIRTIRAYRSSTEVVAVRLHPSNVLEVRMRNNEFRYKAGQFLYLNAPAISNWEWHPFTITSSPDQDYVSVNIAVVGDWTSALVDLLKPGDRGTVQLGKIHLADGRHLLYIDGPYGSSSEEVFDFPNVIMVGGGIGVTPFASLLRSVAHRLRARAGMGSMRQVYFYWVARSAIAFEWFETFLREFEEELHELGMEDFVQINIYLTGGVGGGANNMDAIAQVMYTADEEYDPVTKLRSKTHYGRPDFGRLFDEIAEKHAGQKTALFTCGPKAVSNILYRECRRITLENQHRGTKFLFHKENF